MGEGPPVGPDGAQKRGTGGRAPGTGDSGYIRPARRTEAGLWAPPSRCPEDTAMKAPPRGDPMGSGWVPILLSPSTHPHRAYATVT